jgi:hypothetical protein
MFAAALLAFDRCASPEDVHLVLRSITQNYAPGTRDTGKAAISEAVSRLRTREATTAVVLWNAEADQLLQSCLSMCKRSKLLPRDSSFRCPESRTIESLLSNTNFMAGNSYNQQEEGGDGEDDSSDSELVYDFVEGEGGSSGDLDMA